MISFIIPVRDDADRLRACLLRIRETAYPAEGVEVIVADNGSTDGSGDVARAAGGVVLEMPGASVGALRNAAAARAHGDILAFVDADNEIADGWMSSAADGLADERVAAIGAPYHPPSPATWVQRFYDRLRRHPVEQEQVDWLGSGNMAVRRSAFHEVGGFDVTLDTCEDIDLCRKLRAREYRLLADRRMKNVHHGDPQTLRQVFFGELWRGRDNLRVSLRPPFAARVLVSAAIPLTNLIALAAATAGLMIASRGSLTLSCICLGIIALVIGMRASAMLRPGGAAEWPKALAVAAAYESGRALALAGRFGHGRRRGAAATA